MDAPARHVAASSSVPLAYATPAGRQGSPTWAGFFIAVVGLGLVALGGCFLIGVLIIVDVNQGRINEAAFTLMLVLYACAFGCFGGAVATLVAGMRRLFAAARPD